MKFVSKIDLDLELVLVDGTTRDITGPTLSAREASAKALLMNSGGEDFDRLPAKKRTPEAAAELFAHQLSDVYEDIEPDWWTKNLYIGTIREIRQYVISSLLGVEKRGPSSDGSR